MNTDEFVKNLACILPITEQEDWDNCGIQINCENKEVNRVLVALEITNDVIDEAISIEADMIVTHHPLIFNGIKSIDANDVIGGYIIDLINAGISVYSAHTNFDKAIGGNNDYIANILELENVRPLINNYNEEKITRMGCCNKKTLENLSSKLASELSIDSRNITIVGSPEEIVNTVGICSGSGAEYIDLAMENGCDVFVTGDLKYHDAMRAREKGMCVIDAGHYGTEKIFADAFIEMMEDNKFFEAEFIKSEVDINPFNFVG